MTEDLRNPDSGDCTRDSDAPVCEWKPLCPLEQYFCRRENDLPKCQAGLLLPASTIADININFGPEELYAAHANHHLVPQSNRSSMRGPG